MGRRILAALALAALCGASLPQEADAQRNRRQDPTSEQVAARIGTTMLVPISQRPAAYNLEAFGSYGRVHINMTGVSVGPQDCTSSPLTNFLTSLLVRRNRSAGIAMRVTTAGTGGSAPSTDFPASGTMEATGENRTTLFVANLIKVSKNQSVGSRCRAQVNAVNTYTPLLDLTGAGRSVQVEFLVWTSNEMEPGFIPNTVMSLYSEKALAVLTRVQLQQYATQLVSQFNNSRDDIVGRDLNFLDAPGEYGLALVLDDADRVAAGARIVVEMETVSSMFWPNSGRANFRNAHAATIMTTRLAPNITLASELNQVEQANLAHWTGARASDTNFTNFEAGCAAIQRRIAQTGLIGEDISIALWAMAAQHGEILSNQAAFSRTTCMRNLQRQLAAMGDRRPTSFMIEEARPEEPTYPDARAMDLFMRTKFRPLLNTPFNEGRQELAAGVFLNPEIWVSGLLPAQQTPIVQDNQLTGRFGRVGCFRFTKWREDLNIRGSQVDGVIVLEDGREAFMRAFFPTVSPNGQPVISRLELHSTMPENTRLDIEARHGDQCEIAGWRPAMIFRN